MKIALQEVQQFYTKNVQFINETFYSTLLPPRTIRLLEKKKKRKKSSHGAMLILMSDA